MQPRKIIEHMLQFAVEEYELSMEALRKKKPKEVEREVKRALVAIFRDYLPLTMEKIGLYFDLDYSSIRAHERTHLARIGKDRRYTLVYDNLLKEFKKLIGQSLPKGRTKNEDEIRSRIYQYIYPND